MLSAATRGGWFYRCAGRAYARPAWVLCLSPSSTFGLRLLTVLCRFWYSLSGTLLLFLQRFYVMQWKKYVNLYICPLKCSWFLSLLLFCLSSPLEYIYIYAHMHTYIYICIYVYIYVVILFELLWDGVRTARVLSHSCYNKDPEAQVVTCIDLLLLCRSHIFSLSLSLCIYVCMCVCSSRPGTSFFIQGLRSFQQSQDSVCVLQTWASLIPSWELDN